MSSLYLLIPIAGLFCAIALLLLRWAVNSGQYEDLDRESWRILQEENEQRSSPSEQAPSDTTDKADNS